MCNPKAEDNALVLSAKAVNTSTVSGTLCVCTLVRCNIANMN